ncbi:MAG: radical SAM protein [Verrucomicrobiae bacterium]|nr:radical SAM protein [Verrucomicrobiae bacterium]
MSRIFFLKPGGAQTNFPHCYATLIAHVREQGHQAAFYDASLSKPSPQTLLSSLDFSGYDCLGISLLTGWHPWVKAFVSLFKARHPNIPIIVGGPHVSALGIEAVRHLQADFGVVGEGEIPLGMLLDALKKNDAFESIPNLIFKNGQDYQISTKPRERIKELDRLPLPAYDVVKPENYFHTYLGASVPRRYFQSVQTVTSRGCPFQCTFCATNATWLRRMTFHSPEYVVRELQLLRRQHGVRELWFGDDGFTAHRNRAMEICERMIAEKLDLVWRIPNGIRLETIDDRLAGLMRKAGCYMTGIGVETGSPQVMQRIKKKLALSLIQEKVALLRRHHILTSGFFIVGFPDETADELRETIDFILRSPFDRMQISIFAPYPGSEDFQRLFQDVSQKDYSPAVQAYLDRGILPKYPVQLPIDQIQKVFSRTYLRFYLQPRVVWSLLRDLRPRQFLDVLAHPGFQRIFLFRRDAKETYVEFGNV